MKKEMPLKPLNLKKSAWGGYLGARLVKGLLLIILAIGFGIATSNIKIDDSYIFYTYVKNLSSGLGWVFNRGEYINGTTSALYPILLLIVRLITDLPIDLIGHWLGILGLAIVLITSSSVFKTSWHSIGLLVPAILLNATILDNAVGMETYITMALLLLTLRAYLKDRLFISSTLFGLATLSRPDSLIFGGVLFFDYLARNKRLPNLKFAAPFCLIVGSWLIFSQYTFGSLLPNTVGAKLAQSGHRYWGGTYGFFLGSDRLLSSFNYLAYLIPIAVWILISEFAQLKYNRSILLILIWGALYFIAYAFVIHAPPYRWYYVPLLLPITLLIFLPISKTPLIAQIIFSGLLIAGAFQKIYQQASSPVTPKHEIYKAAADWFNTNTPPGTTIGAMEIGVLGYYLNDAKIIDALGLVSHASNFISTGKHGWFIKEFHPDFIITNNPPRHILEEFVNTDWFQESYDLRTEVTTKKNRRGVRVFQRRDLLLQPQSKP